MVSELNGINCLFPELNVNRSGISNNWFGRRFNVLRNMLFAGFSMQAIPSIFAQVADSEPSCLNGTFVVAPEGNVTQLHSYIWRVIPTYSNALNSSAVSNCCEQMGATFDAVMEQLAGWVNNSQSNEICGENATEIFSLWANGESLSVWLQTNSSDLLSSLCNLSGGVFPVANEDIYTLREQWAQCEEANSTAFHVQWWHAGLTLLGFFAFSLSLSLCARRTCADRQPDEPTNAISKLSGDIPLVVYERVTPTDLSSQKEGEQLEDHVEIELDIEGNTRVVD